MIIFYICVSIKVSEQIVKSIIFFEENFKVLKNKS